MSNLIAYNTYYKEGDLTRDSYLDQWLRDVTQEELGPSNDRFLLYGIAATDSRENLANKINDSTCHAQPTVKLLEFLVVRSTHSLPP